MNLAGPRTFRAKLLTIVLVALGLGVLARTLTNYALWGGLVTTPHAALGTASAAGPFLREIFARGTGCCSTGSTGSSRTRRCTFSQGQACWCSRDMAIDCRAIH